LEITAFKDMQFPRHENGIPGLTMSPKILCLYAFFSEEISDTFRLRKSWKVPKIDQVMGGKVKTENTAPGAHARAQTDSDQPGVTSKSF
jgi:hypothetical protein